MVFNYAMNLQKQSDRSVPLFGAKFTFYVDEEMTRLVYFVPVGTEDQKMYRVGKAEDAGAITEIPADFTLVGEHGVEYLDCPMTGGRIGAHNRELVRGQLAGCGHCVLRARCNYRKRGITCAEQ